MDRSSLSTFSYDDPIEKAVQEIWLQHPGIGIKNLTEKLKDRFPPVVHPNLSKQRVKAAKEAIPYRYIETTYEYNCEKDGEHQNMDMVKESTETNTPDAQHHQQHQQQQQNFPFTPEKMEFIQQKIQQRQSLRKEKRYKESDEICRGLETMGICLHDHSKSWTIDIQVVKKRRFEEEDGDITTTTESDNVSGGIPCSMCGRYFASRNLVFKHLRDVASGCGNRIFASGQSLPDSPQELLKRQQKEKNFRVRGRSRGGRKNLNEQQQDHNNQLDDNINNQKIIDPKACLWFGDIPLAWTTYNLNYKRFRALLREYLPRDVPFPWIQKVVRKSYKDYKNNCSIHLGYAIIVFRDEDEANLVLKKMNGAMIDPTEVFTKDVLNNGNNKKEEETDDKLLSLPSFVLKVQHHDVASSNENDNNNDNNTTSQKTLAGQDPTLIDQFRPLSTHQLKERIRRWETLRHRQNDNNEVENGDDIGTTTTDAIADNNHHHDVVVQKRKQERQLSDYEQHKDCLHQLVQYYTIYDPRIFVHRQGRLLPNCICNRLLDILKNLRWPAEHGRPAMSSERYLVLRPDSVTTQTFFSELNNACADLIQSVDRNYTYSAIAVTKNFVSSPHIDERDQTFQYAVSLGECDDGGELCVEGYASQENSDDKEGELHRNQKDDDYVNVVDTHNRIGKVDGRHIHWVRTWTGGDRYSLIYYDTRKQNSTPIIPAGVDEEFFLKKNC